MSTCHTTTEEEQQQPHLLKQIIVSIVTTQQSLHDVRCCFACHQPIEDTQSAMNQIIEDPSRVCNNKQHVETYKHQTITPTETPVCSNRYIRAYHAEGECPAIIENHIKSMIYSRVTIPELIAIREKTEGRMEFNQFKNAFHASKLNITSSYPDADSLVVKAISIDTPLEADSSHGLHTSLMISMPIRISHFLQVRAQAWTETQMYSLFQRISILDITINNTYVIPVQVKELSKIANECFGGGSSSKDPSKLNIQGSINGFRLPNPDSSVTIWRLIVKVEFDIQSYRTFLWNLFYQLFLHPDTDHPNIMTWEQVFSTDVLDFVNLERRLLSEQVGFIPGEATLTINQRRRTWIDRREFAYHLLSECIVNLKKALTKELVNNVREVETQSVNQIDKRTVVSDETIDMLEYRINVQRIEQKDQPNSVYYTQSYTDLSPRGLLCWKVAQPQQQQPMFCPFIFADAITTHKGDMQTMGFIEQPMDTLIPVYPVPTS